ncbi:MAG: tetratricopeptide repeat protein [Agarilytica sp.]
MNKFLVLAVTRVKTALLHVMLVLISWQLFGCGASGVKQDVSTIAAPTLIDSSAYLPEQEFDEDNGVYLPYEGNENPYLAQKGRIKKEAVQAFIQAKRHFKREQYDACENELKRVVELDGKLSGPWLMRGEIAEINKDTPLAMEHYQKAIEVNPKNINVYLKLAKLQRVEAQFIQAQNTLAKALGIWPDFPEAHLNIGVIYDVYLNHPIRAQKHIEAYVFLAKEPDPKALKWAEEVRSRTKLEKNYHPVVAPAAPVE